jgi:hypothetical protein
VDRESIACGQGTGRERRIVLKWEEKKGNVNARKGSAMKGRIWTSSLVILAVLASAWLLAGCEGSGKLGLFEYFNQARDQIKSANSFHMTGDMKISFGDNTGSDSVDVLFEFIFQADEAGGGIAKMSMRYQPSGESGLLTPTGESYEMEGYVTNEAIYLQDPISGEWGYQKIDITSLLSSTNQGMTPQSVVQLLEAADQVEVLEEKEGYIKYRLVMDPDKIFTPEVLDYARKSFESNQELNEIMKGVKWEDYLDGIKAIVSQMEFVVTVDKSSRLITEMEVKIDNFLEAMTPYLGEGSIPEGAWFNMSLHYNISDYGKEFDIELPEEVKNSRPLEEVLKD